MSEDTIARIKNLGGMQQGVLAFLAMVMLLYIFVQCDLWFFIFLAI